MFHFFYEQYFRLSTRAAHSLCLFFLYVFFFRCSRAANGDIVDDKGNETVVHRTGRQVGRYENSL